MNRETLKALKGSIKKWEGIVAGKIRDEGVYNCPLCKLFYEDDCKGCPIYQKTGYVGCIGTPYEHFCSEAPMCGLKADTPERLRAAKAEVKFLKSLLPDQGEK